MAYKKTDHPDDRAEYDFVANPDPQDGSGYIPGLRLWARNTISFNSASPDWMYGGPKDPNFPSGTYNRNSAAGADYDDEFYPMNIAVDSDDFQTSQAAFDAEFTKWTNNTSYPMIGGQLYPKGEQFKVIEGTVSANGPSVQTYKIGASQFQYLMFYSYTAEGEDPPEFGLIARVVIEDNGSLITQDEYEFSNANFGRFSMRARQLQERFNLRFELERYELPNSPNNDDSFVRFRLGGRLGRLQTPQI